MDEKEIRERYREEWSIGWFQDAIEYLLFSHIKELKEDGKRKEEVFINTVSKWEKAEARAMELEEGIETIINSGYINSLNMKVKLGKLVEKKKDG